MSGSEKRREELLREVRRSGMRGNTPAIHPRYRSLYRSLYEEDSIHMTSGTLGARILLSLILFAVFLSADYSDKSILKFSQTEIIEDIQAQPDYHSYLSRFLDFLP